MKSREYRQMQKNWKKINGKPGTRAVKGFNRDKLILVTLLVLLLITLYTTIVPIIVRYVYSGTHQVVTVYGGVQYLNMNSFVAHEKFFYSIQAFSLIWAAYVWYSWLKYKRLNIWVFVSTGINMAYFIYWLLNYNDARLNINQIMNRADFVSISQTLKDYTKHFFIYVGIFGGLASISLVCVITVIVTNK